MSGRLSHAMIAGLIAGATLTGCGGSSGSSTTSPTDVQSCLQDAGYGVTTVPASDVKDSGPENRGPGQTGELLVGLNGAKPQIGADDADAVVAFFDSASHASSAPGTKESNPILHVTAIGTTTVQGTSHLAETVSKQAKSASDARAAFNAELKKIEDCA
jgi:hypothetical protein